jgi:hypothetical protein
VAKRIAALNTAIGWPADASIAAADRARVRTQVAREFFRAEHGREPVNAQELAGQIAKNSRPRTQTVAGYDLTFSPVKSVLNRPGSDGGSDSRKDEDHASTEEVPAGVAGQGDAAGA